MNAVFGDSFYYIALLNPADQHHLAAVAATRALQSRMLTTIWVHTEVADALSHPSARNQAHQFLLRLAVDSNTDVVSADHAWYERGLSLYGKRPDKNWSLTDCISFEVMKERGITDALTGDHHFVQAGFRALMLPA